MSKVCIIDGKYRVTGRGCYVSKEIRGAIDYGSIRVIDEKICHAISVDPQGFFCKRDEVMWSALRLSELPLEITEHIVKLKDTARDLKSVDEGQARTDAYLQEQIESMRSGHLTIIDNLEGQIEEIQTVLDLAMSEISTLTCYVSKLVDERNTKVPKKKVSKKYRVPRDPKKKTEGDN